MSNTSDTTSALAVLVDLIADRVVERLRSAAANEHEAYYTAKTAPCGARTFLAAARAAAFPSYRRGRRVLARVADVRAWIESAPRPTRAEPPEASLTDEALLERAGIRRRGSR